MNGSVVTIVRIRSYQSVIILSYHAPAFRASLGRAPIRQFRINRQGKGEGMNRGTSRALAAFISTTMMGAMALPAAADYGPVVVKTLPNRDLAPYSLIAGTDGSFYGITYSGVSLVRIPPNGIVKTLFTPAMTDPSGWDISNVVQGSDGTLYIATVSGGANNNGAVSKLTPDGKLTVLHDFSAASPQGLVYVNADGGMPVNLAIASDGSLLGTAVFFGPEGGGTVFRIKQDGSFSTLASFNGDDTQAIKGGYGPGPVLIGKDGAIYVLNRGGDVNGTGALVRIAGDGTVSEVAVNDGQASGLHYLVQDGVGNFYSLDINLNIWKTTPAGQVSTIQDDFYIFPNDQTVLFASPNGQVFLSSQFYGAFKFGFLGQVVNGENLQALTFFGYPLYNGAYPVSATVGTDGNIYGVTSSGSGLFGSAALYRLALPAPAGWGTGPAPDVSLSLSQSTITVGQSATVSWTINGAADCEMYQDFGGVKMLSGSGSRVFKPWLKGQYVFELNCANNGMSAHDQVRLNVEKK